MHQGRIGVAAALAPNVQFAQNRPTVAVKYRGSVEFDFALAWPAWNGDVTALSQLQSLETLTMGLQAQLELVWTGGRRTPGKFSPEAPGLD